MSSEEQRIDSPVDREAGYLKRRVYSEAKAAVTASSTAATLIHVMLATAYARRLGQQTPTRERRTSDPWADEHRVW